MTPQERHRMRELANSYDEMQSLIDEMEKARKKIAALSADDVSKLVVWKKNVGVVVELGNVSNWREIMEVIGDRLEAQIRFVRNFQKHIPTT